MVSEFQKLVAVKEKMFQKQRLGNILEKARARLKSENENLEIVCDFGERKMRCG